MFAIARPRGRRLKKKTNNKYLTKKLMKLLIPYPLLDVGDGDHDLKNKNNNKNPKLETRLYYNIYHNYSDDDGGADEAPGHHC